MNPPNPPRYATEHSSPATTACSNNLLHSFPTNIQLCQPRYCFPCMGFADNGYALQQDRQFTYYVTLRGVHVTTVAVEKSKYYIFRVCVCRLRCPARKAHAPYFHLWLVRLYHIFPTYLIKGTIFGKRVTEDTMCAVECNSTLYLVQKVCAVECNSTLYLVQR